MEYVGCPTCDLAMVEIWDLSKRAKGIGCAVHGIPDAKGGPGSGPRPGGGQHVSEQTAADHLAEEHNSNGASAGNSHISFHEGLHRSAQTRYENSGRGPSNDHLLAPANHLSQKSVEVEDIKGDSPGHEFRGNQYSGGGGGTAHSHANEPVDVGAHMTDQHGGTGTGKDHASQHALGLSLTQLHAAPLNHIAHLIEKHWAKVNFGARPYLDAMHSMSKITDKYGADSGKSVVAYFLSNASSFHGPEATILRTELKDRMKATPW